MITLLRWILWPFSIIYQVVIRIRNFCYDRGLFKSTSFDIPTIVIGNLAIGGTGKSPTTEYLIRLLSPIHRVATLSRGYGRRTKGFGYVHITSKTLEVGDEPLQFKRKFPHITVTVSEDRCSGIQQIKDTHDVILLDDAYQHRRLKAGCAILLLEYKSLHKPFVMLPTGNFRDDFSSAKRADIILITKCPDEIPAKEKNVLEKRIRRHSSASLFYTKITYGTVLDRYRNPAQAQLESMDILLFCGIANPEPLITYLERAGNTVYTVIYPDHHNFTYQEYDQIKQKYDKLYSEKKIILTTEKDFQRLDIDVFDGYPVYYIPIEISFLSNQDIFDRYVFSYLRK